MNKTMQKIIAAVLTIVLALSLPISAIAAENDVKTPIIIIPGIGQSLTEAFNEDGTHLAYTNELELPAIDAKDLIATLALPAVKTLIRRKDEKLSAAAYNFMADFFGAYRRNTDGTAVYKTVVKEFNAPYSALSAEDQAEIDHHITLDALREYNDVRYYFTYDCFGSVQEAADRLHRYVEMVLEQTGAEKVSIVPVSQGGALFVEYVDLYPQDHKLFDRIIGFVPAYDGSVIVGDVLTDQVNIYDVNYLHETVLPGLLGYNNTTYALSFALRAAFSEEALVPVLKSALKGVVDCLAINNTMMWSLCPTEFYEQAADRLLSDGQHNSIKAETDRYMQARANFKSNLDSIIAGGAVVHTVASYDVPVFMSFLFKHGDTDCDDLLHVASPSLGATAMSHGVALPADYTAENPVCTNPAHNHISPDRLIDVSTAYLPENTWFFKGVSHMGLNNRTDVKDFAIGLMINDDITDIYTYEGQTQFVQLPDYKTVHNMQTGMLEYYDGDEFVYAEKYSESKDDTGFSILKLMFNLTNIIFRLLSLK